MLFNSVHFLIFLPVVAVLHFLLPHRFRWVLLLGASYYFYACWRPEYLLLVLFSTTVDYCAAYRMSLVPTRRGRGKYLLVSLLLNVGLLCYYKYADFLAGNVAELLRHVGVVYAHRSFDILLPVGLSFYTFQSLSYTIDVFRGRVQAERHFGKFALFISFFPQLVAGPIERPSNLLPQIDRPKAFDEGRVVAGLHQMLWGFFKKVVVADGCAAWVDAVYNKPQSYAGWPLVVATYLFAVQIYCDFSGYSDIAIGTARVLGFRFVENFRRPYLAQSFTDFWRRWHVSLSSWFKDYLYIPLGGNRVPGWRAAVNLFVVFLVSGLWHGAAWTFVVWGALHGVCVVASRGWEALRERRPHWLRLPPLPGARLAGRLVATAFVFHVVLVGWVFFRARSLADALYVLGHAFARSRPAGALAQMGQGLSFRGGADFGRRDLFLAAATLLVLVVVEVLEEVRGEPIWSVRLPRPVRWAFALLLGLGIANLGTIQQVPFIYFQF
jgi:D-alanyl-lipoteichoic acid acyltransferase DltB (MBOAT superfamily)